jgi:amidohydrolase
MPNKKEKAFNNWLVAVRRDFHAHPELAFEERRTTKKLTRLLEDLGVEVQGFKTHTGVVGLLRGGADGPTIALRADIDALPVEELGEADYRSRHEGRMHACGHDANTAIMVGVARRLVDSGAMRQCSGNVKFIFQPAEERLSGARMMINAGVLESPSVDRLLAGHMSPDIPVGRIGVFKNIGYASSDRFEIKVIGKGTHGARPEEGSDPIVAGAALITLLQSVVSRNVKPTLAGVITVGLFQGGTVGNVIPESARMTGTIRALDADVRRTLIRRLKEVSAGVAAGYGVRCEVRVNDGSPVLVTDESVSAFIYETACKVLGPDKVQYIPPIMGSEDFAFYTLRCPATIIRLGCANSATGIVHPLHSAYFDIDERVLAIGVDVFSQAVVRYLGNQPSTADHDADR